MTGRIHVMAITALVACTLVSGAGQQLAVGRQLLSDFVAPPIDRGIRDVDPPAPPRSTRTDRLPSRSEPYVRGSVIVKFKDSISHDQRITALSTVRATSLPAPSYADFDIVSIDPTADPETVARNLSVRPDVEYAQARYRVRPTFVPNDPLYSRQWNFALLDMEQAWDLNLGASSQVVVAVLDTGIAYRNGTIRYVAQGFSVQGTPFPALGAVTIPFAAAPELGGPVRFVAPHDFIWDDSTPVDMDGHGTHVAGTVGQLTNNGIGVAGMAFNVRLMPVKVIATDWDFVFGAPNDGTDDVVARGIRYAVDNGANIINMSLGRGGPPAPAVEAAIQYAVGHGVFVAVAAGNEAQQGNEPNRVAEFARKIDGMVAVGAIGRDRVRAFYSTTGSYVELVAPGGDELRNGTTGGILQQTYDSDLVDTISSGPVQFGPPRFDVFVYNYYQGTSMATPHVAGFAALLYQQGITSPAAIEAIMKRSATDLGLPGRDDEYGDGLINPRAALRGLGLLR
jgi:serine protease